MFNKLLHPPKLVAYLFPVVWFISVAVSALEAYFYPGFTHNHLYFNPVAMYLLMGLVGIYASFGSIREDDFPLRLFRKLIYAATALFGLGYILMMILENVTYPNYVFSTFHIRPDQLLTPFCLAIFAGLIVSKSILIQKVGGSENTKFRTKILIALLILWIMIPDIIVIGTTVAKNLVFIVKNPTATYDRKMEEKVGKLFYDYVTFVKENTPENAKILVPPFPAYPWPQTGNIAYVRYFLYPRDLFNGEEYSSVYDLEKEGIEYVLLVWGETTATSGNYTHGWPKFDVSASEIIYWKPDSGITIKKENYDYDKVKGHELWGAIKVKK